GGRGPGPIRIVVPGRGKGSRTDPGVDPRTGEGVPDRSGSSIQRGERVPDRSGSSSPNEGATPGAAARGRDVVRVVVVGGVGRRAVRGARAGWCSRCVVRLESSLDQRNHGGGEGTEEPTEVRRTRPRRPETPRRRDLPALEGYLGGTPAAGV